MSLSALAGETVAFTVVAIGRPTLIYQWCKNGVDIAGASNATLVTLASISIADVAIYASTTYTYSEPVVVPGVVTA